MWPTEDSPEYSGFVPGQDERDKARKLAKIVKFNHVLGLFKLDSHDKFVVAIEEFCKTLPESLAESLESFRSLASRLWQYVRCRQIEKVVSALYAENEAHFKEELPYWHDFQVAAAEILQEHHPKANHCESIPADLVLLQQVENCPTWEFGVSVFYLTRLLYSLQERWEQPEQPQPEQPQPEQPEQLEPQLTPEVIAAIKDVRRDWCPAKTTWHLIYAREAINKHYRAKLGEVVPSTPELLELVQQLISRGELKLPPNAEVSKGVFLTAELHGWLAFVQPQPTDIPRNEEIETHKVYGIALYECLKKVTIFWIFLSGIPVRVTICGSVSGTTLPHCASTIT